MYENKVSEISPEMLLNEVSKLKYDGHRLVQICCTKAGEEYELTYSLGLEYDLLNLRFRIAEGTEISSISQIFPAAFLYENEIHDLFGIPFARITVDYQGNLYRIDQKTPFH